MNTTLPPNEFEMSRMRTRLFEALPHTRMRRRRRVILVAGLSAAVLVGGATTAGALFVGLASAHARNTSFECYTSDDLNAPHATTMFADGYQDDGSLSSISDRVRLAIATCTAGYSAVETDLSLRGDPIVVPNPTACLLEDGRLAVLPNQGALPPGEFCRSLALAAPME